jgi:hypothetical protein
MYVNTSDGLNLRIAPLSSSQRIRTLPFGSKVTVISISETRITIDNILSSWYQVQFENDIGWVFGGYLSKISPHNNLLIGDWQTETHFYRFYDNGKYNGGRKHSSLVTSGNWFLADNNVLFLSGTAGDDSGKLIKYTDIHRIILNNNTIRFPDIDRDYLRKPLSYDETGLPPL